MRRALIANLLTALFTVFCFTCVLPCAHASSPGSTSSPASSESSQETTSPYPWKKNIITTYFWIGQGCSSYNDTTNYQSAWDESWKKNYGGTDDPERRSGLLPTRFAATLNPFYCALPFNDLANPELARKYVPWWKTPPRGLIPVSQCKGRWLQIRNASGKSCYAQWEDVGPYRTDHARYVFGNERPKTNTKAGLDVSPAVRDFLGLQGLDMTDWRFVEAEDVPEGPWLKYYEQAIVYSALKPKEVAAAKSAKPLKPGKSGTAE